MLSSTAHDWMCNVLQKTESSQPCSFYTPCFQAPMRIVCAIVQKLTAMSLIGVLIVLTVLYIFDHLVD